MDEITCMAPTFVPRTWTDWLATGGTGDTGAKSWKFFMEAYIHNVLIAITVTKDSHSDVIIRCFHSMKKNEGPHTRLVCAQSASFAEVSKVHRSCTAGCGVTALIPLHSFLSLLTIHAVS